MYMYIYLYICSLCNVHNNKETRAIVKKFTKYCSAY